MAGFGNYLSITFPQDLHLKKIADIKTIVYDSHDMEERITSRFLALSGKERIPYENEDELGEILQWLKKRGLPSKELIVLRRFLGRIFQKCPGSAGMICCNYRLLNTCFDCLYDCTYCFLNSYLNAYGINQFTHLDAMEEEILKGVDANDGLIHRIGTGEFTDSLMMDEITGIAEPLIISLSRRRDIMIEFKTKSDNICHLLDIEEKGNAVLAWSLNTPRAIELYEAGTADLGMRLAAARRAQEAGYLLAFHFDPIILYEGMLPDYEALAHRLFSVIDPSGVAWISLGCFRHSSGFREIIMEKYPAERLTTAEMFPGSDGKMRYLRHRRIELYGRMRDIISSYSSVPFVYLCMEPAEVWNDFSGADYSCSDDLEVAMSDHLKKVIPRLR
jgi:spore photoproduct lyase